MVTFHAVSLADTLSDKGIILNRITKETVFTITIANNWINKLIEYDKPCQNTEETLERYQHVSNLLTEGTAQSNVSRYLQ